MSFFKSSNFGKKRQLAKFFSNVKLGNIADVEAALSKGKVDFLNKRDEDEWTPLFWSCFNGHFEITKLLITAGSAVSLEDNQGRTPLYLHCGWHGDPEMTKLLIKSGSNIHSKNNDGWNCIHICAFRGTALAIDTLVEAGVDMFQLDNHKRTPLELAKSKGHDSVINELKRIARNQLFNAAKLGKPAIVQAILESKHDIDVNVQDVTGWTALHFAMKSGSEAVVKVLTAFGADPTITNMKGETPEMIAEKSDHLGALKVLRRTSLPPAVDRKIVQPAREEDKQNNNDHQVDEKVELVESPPPVVVEVSSSQAKPVVSPGQPGSKVVDILENLRKKNAERKSQISQAKSEALSQLSEEEKLYLQKSSEKKVFSPDDFLTPEERAYFKDNNNMDGENGGDGGNVGSETQVGDNDFVFNENNSFDQIVVSSNGGDDFHNNNNNNRGMENVGFNSNMGDFNEIPQIDIVNSGYNTIPENNNLVHSGNNNINNQEVKIDVNVVVADDADDLSSLLDKEISSFLGENSPSMDEINELLNKNKGLNDINDILADLNNSQNIQDEATTLFNQLDMSLKDTEAILCGLSPLESPNGSNPLTPVSAPSPLVSASVPVSNTAKEPGFDFNNELDDLLDSMGI